MLWLFTTQGRGEHNLYTHASQGYREGVVHVVCGQQLGIGEHWELDDGGHTGKRCAKCLAIMEGERDIEDAVSVSCMLSLDKAAEVLLGPVNEHFRSAEKADGIIVHRLALDFPSYTWLSMKTYRQTRVPVRMTILGVEQTFSCRVIYTRILSRIGDVPVLVNLGLKFDDVPKIVDGRPIYTWMLSNHATTAPARVAHAVPSRREGRITGVPALCGIEHFSGGYWDTVEDGGRGAFVYCQECGKVIERMGIGS